MQEDEVSVGYDELVFIPEGAGGGFDEVEQTVAAWADVRTVLNVVRGPKGLGRNVVTLVEQRVERFDD